METYALHNIDTELSLLSKIKSTQRNCPIMGRKKDLLLKRTLLIAKEARKSSMIRLANTRSI